MLKDLTQRRRLKRSVIQNVSQLRRLVSTDRKTRQPEQSNEKRPAYQHPRCMLAQSQQAVLQESFEQHLTSHLEKKKLTAIMKQRDWREVGRRQDISQWAGPRVMFQVIDGCGPDQSGVSRMKTRMGSRDVWKVELTGIIDWASGESRNNQMDQRKEWHHLLRQRTLEKEKDS